MEFASHTHAVIDFRPTKHAKGSQEKMKNYPSVHDRCASLGQLVENMHLATTTTGKSFLN